MDAKQVGLGTLQVLVFMAFQFFLGNVLGPFQWLVAVIVFAVILWLIGRVSMPKRPPAELEELWKFITVLAVVLTAIYTIVGLTPMMAMMMPSNVTMSQVTSVFLAFWLAIFGAGMLITGWTTKWGVTAATGVIWLFAAVINVNGFLPGVYFDFALITGFPFIIYGLITKG